MEPAQQSTTTTGALANDATQPSSTATEPARRRTGNLQAQLADALDSGASVIRERAATVAATPADTGSEGAGVASALLEQVVPQLTARGELAAGVMERGATWLRENDLSDLEGRVMGQLEQHPVRTLGIAAAVGFLLARRD